MYADFYDQKWRLNLKMTGDTPLAQTRGASPAFLPLLLRLVRQADKVLEVGCGTGYLAFAVARMGPRSVIATDVSAVAVQAAQTHAARMAGPKPEFKTALATALPFDDDSFDFVYSVEVLEHLHERDVPTHFSEVWRVLKPGGSFWVMTPSRNTENSVHERWGISASSTPDEDIQDIHLKEWTYSELIPKVREAGFERLRSPWQHKFAQSMPLIPIEAKAFLESIIPFLPKAGRRIYARVSGTSNCSLTGRKPQGAVSVRKFSAA
jgi:ubiquinone/menaquinone biosynthesis C-methylase UbiE